MSIVTKSVTDYLEKLAKDNHLILTKAVDGKESLKLIMESTLRYYYGDHSVTFRILELCDDPLFTIIKSILRTMPTLGNDVLGKEEFWMQEAIEQSLSISDPNFFTKLHAIIDPYIKRVSLLYADHLLRNYVFDNQSILKREGSVDYYKNPHLVPRDKVSTIVNEDSYTIELVRDNNKVLLDFNTQFNTKDPDLITKVDQYIHSIGGI